MTDFRLFPRVFGDVMTSVVSEYDPVNGLKPVYEFGTYLELTKQIVIKDRNIAAGKVEVKYPLVWLVWEANENTKTWTTDAQYTINPRIFICTHTNSDYSSDQRYSENFEAILYPIWLIIREEMGYNNQIGSFTAQNYSDSEHLYWGESLGFEKKKNVLFDTLDAIEIKFTELEIFKNC